MLLLLQASTPNTVPYMILGYSLIGGVGLIYVASLLLRQRNLLRDLEVLATLKADEE